MSTGTDADKNEALFLQFVMSLMQSGMMQLGKVINPMTQKIDKDLRGAEATIEMLVMLRSKTEGNLTKTEENFLTNAVSSLQMNYVDELESEKKQEQESTGTPPEEPDTEEAPTGEDTEKSD